MKRTVLLLLLAAAGILMLTECASRHTMTSQGTAPIYSTHKPYTRWWWFAADIDTNDVRDQLLWLRDHGFGGVEVAWVYPAFLDTTVQHEEFLSAEWTRWVSATKRMADSLGLGCDYTFGTLWPFNDVNLPDGDQTRTYKDSVEVARRAYVWDHPRQGRILNHLDRNAFRRYADKLNRALAPALKGNRSGLFVDSWEVETLYAWTDGFGDEFYRQHGYRIEPYMEAESLMEEANRDVFYDYMSTLSQYALNEFYAPFGENATRVGAFSRSQCAGAPADLLTAYTLVDVPETEAILYEPSFSKIAASAAALAGKPVVSAETFTCAYGWTGLLKDNGHGKSPYQGKEQPADLKLICDALFANGTNQIFWHGFAYNKLGSNLQHFYTTCQVSMNEADYLTGETLTDFNRYMTTVSDYMSRGQSYSDMAVYMPLEDAWMSGFYPEEYRKVMKWVWGQYELRFIRTPEEYKGMQPLWVNARFLGDATFADGVLYCGAMQFRSLYVGVEYMELGALREVLRLAEEGLPVQLSVVPKEPGVNKHEAEYASLLRRLRALTNVGMGGNSSIVAHKPLIEGKDLPDFWCRHHGDDFYVFFANPMTQTIKYPLSYCYALTDKGSTRNIVVNHHGKSEAFTLRFRPTESLIVQVSRKGIRQIPLNYLPERIDK